MYKVEQADLGYFKVNPVPNQKDLEKFYADKYFQKCVSNSYSQEYTNDEIEWLLGAAKVTQYLYEQKNGKSTGSFFDVGCGEGFFAGYFYKEGWDVKACDFSKYGVENHHPQILDFFEQGDIYKILEGEISAGNSYSLVNLSNVLEHVVDPVELLKMLKEIMKEDTLLRICVPNDFSHIQQYLLDQELTTDTWVKPPEHLSYFTPSTLDKLVASIGLNTFKTITTFPIEYFIFNEHSNYAKDKTLGKQSHFARCKIENLLLRKSIEDYVKYYEYSSKLENGRDIITFVSL